MDPSLKKKLTRQRRKHRVDVSSPEPTHVPETQTPLQQQSPPTLSQNYGYPNQNPYQHMQNQIPVQQNQTQFPYQHNQTQNPYQQNQTQNPYQQNYHQYQYDGPPGFGYQIPSQPSEEVPPYIPDTSHIRETQKSSSEEFESSDETPPNQHFTQRAKRKKWSDEEEIALSKAYIHCSEDQENGNKKSRTALWADILAHFKTQMGWSDRTCSQVNSKWKDLQHKVNRFNCIFNKIRNRPQSGRSDVDVERLARAEHIKRFNKPFQHDGAWGILRDKEKWLTVGKAGTNEPHFSGKRNKTSLSGEYTSGSSSRFSGNSVNLSSIPDADVMEDNVSQPIQARQRKGKKAQSDDRGRDEASREECRLKRMTIYEKNEEMKAQILQEELQALQDKRFEKDLQFFLKPHDHLTGVQLQIVLARKEKVAKIHGWQM